MMKVQTMLIVAVALLLAGGAVAQIDPDPDGMSVYFDTEGVNFCFETGGEYIEVTAYLLLTNPSREVMLAFEAHVEWEIEALNERPWIYVNFSDYNQPFGNDFSALFFDPVIMDDSAILIMYKEMIFVGDPTEHAIFIVDGVPGSQSFPMGAPGYLSGDWELVPCNLIHASPGEPVAWINHPDACDTVAGERMAWGEVKSLY